MARLKNPMTSSDRPTSRSHADSVSKMSRKGRPAAKPSAIITSVGRSA